MPYKVRRGKLFFEPTVGNGPCRRRTVGQPFRRVIVFGDGFLHVTKASTPGRKHKSVPSTARPLQMPAQSWDDTAAKAKAARIERNRPRASVPGSVRRAAAGAALTASAAP